MNVSPAEKLIFFNSASFRRAMSFFAFRKNSTCGDLAVWRQDPGVSLIIASKGPTLVSMRETWYVVDLHCGLPLPPNLETQRCYQQCPILWSSGPFFSSHSHFLSDRNILASRSSGLISEPSSCACMYPAEVSLWTSFLDLIRVLDGKLRSPVVRLAFSQASKEGLSWRCAFTNK